MKNVTYNIEDILILNDDLYRVYRKSSALPTFHKHFCLVS